MPGGDGTGPMGQGSMTGRASGYCAGNSHPGYINPIPRLGLGLGKGRGFLSYPQGYIHSEQYSYPTFMKPYCGMGFLGRRGGGRGRRFRQW